MFFFRWQNVDDPRLLFRDWWSFALAGGVLIVLGVAIAVMPAILVALAAGAVISAGIYLLSLGLAMRPVEQGRTARVEVHVPRGDERFSRPIGGAWRW